MITHLLHNIPNLILQNLFMTLYLKYRPLDFSSLVGQGFIKESLQAAVQNNKTVWAYLFTGPRGTGKTSTARIFAKAINCLSPKNGNPCWFCEICKAFTNGRLIDIIEIDAASYTGVDNIREIIERAQFQPTQCKYKVYIIDEVHMLSKWAFNALLKILEEPPKHVKFILATTDVHKVPETILSRCQRYDFRSISESDIRERLIYVAKSEGIEIDIESLNYITKEAKWWLRNALTLFEQLIVGSSITFSYIESTLWVSSESEKEIFLTKLLAHDTTLLHDYDSLLEAWKNPSLFIKDVLFMLQEQAESILVSWGNIEKHLWVLEILSKLIWSLKYSFDEALLIRISLLKILSWYTEQTHDAAHVKRLGVPKNTPSPQKISEKLKVTPEEKILHTQEELEIDQVAHVFWVESLSSETRSWNEVSEISTTDLIEKIKKLWWKAAISMSIKWATFSQSSDTYNIFAKTKMAREQLSKSDNKTLVLQALQEISPDIKHLLIH